MTLVKPSPIGVVIGPFSATLFFRIDSSSGGGSVVPCSASAGAPAVNSSQVGVEAGGVEHAQHGARDFGSDAVARNQRDAMGHLRTPVVERLMRVPVIPNPAE